MRIKQLPLAEDHLRPSETDCISPIDDTATTQRRVKGTLKAASYWGSGATSKAEQHLGAAVYMWMSGIAGRPVSTQGSTRSVAPKMTFQARSQR